MLQRPSANEFDPYYAAYVDAVPEGDVVGLLAAQPAILGRLAAAVGAERERFRYAPGKWSVREVYGHLIDCERLFGYRAFRIGHGDRTPLAAFDQEPYVAAGGFDEIPLGESAAEFAVVREANLRVLGRVLPVAADQRGVANDAEITLRALVFVLAGHVEHHLRVLATLYGISIES